MGTSSSRRLLVTVQGSCGKQVGRVLQGPVVQQQQRQQQPWSEQPLRQAAGRRLPWPSEVAAVEAAAHMVSQVQVDARAGKVGGGVLGELQEGRAEGGIQVWHSQQLTASKMEGVAMRSYPAV